MKPFSLDDIRNSPVAHLNEHLWQQPQGSVPEKKSKYGSRIVEIDGLKFRSVKEARRYRELKMGQEAGLIRDLRMQVEYELNKGGTHSLKYQADFVYVDVATGHQLVEDCKGYRTKVYQKKARLMKEVHGIIIKEV